MRSPWKKILVPSAVLIPVLLVLGGYAGSGGSDVQAGGTQAVTFYVS